MSKELYSLLIQDSPDLLVTGNYTLAQVSTTRLRSVFQAEWTVTLARQEQHFYRAFANKTGRKDGPSSSVAHSEQLTKVWPARIHGYMQMPGAYKYVDGYV